jgi:hypothetical protein
MATRDAARLRARRRAARINETVFLVYDPTETDGPTDHAYFSATSEELDTFYSGIDRNDILEAFEATR